MKKAILIPVYNEGKTIKEVIKDAKRKNETIIIIDDGSTDNSLEIIKKEEVVLIQNKKNVGLVESIKKGYRYALKNGYEVVTRIDGDGQMNINTYDILIKKYNATKADVISASYNKNTPWMIKKDIWIYSSLFNIATKQKSKDILSEYRVFSRKAMKGYLTSDVKDYSSNLSIISLFKKGCKLEEIKYGINYHLAYKRPFPLDGLISLRINFLSEIWKLNTYRSKIVFLISIPLLILLLLFNMTIGYRYNSCIPKKLLRQ